MLRDTTNRRRLVSLSPEGNQMTLTVVSGGGSWVRSILVMNERDSLLIEADIWIVFRKRPGNYRKSFKASYL